MPAHFSPTPLSPTRFSPRCLRLGGVLAGTCLSLIALAPVAAQAQSYTLTDLGTLGGNSSTGFGVNASGQVTGDARTAGGTDHAFLSGPNGAPLTAANDLGTLGGTFSEGFGVNASGQVTGDSTTAGGADHAFLSGPNGGALQDLGTLGGTFSEGVNVNAAGQVVGDSTTASGDYHAFLFSGGVLIDLNTLIAPGSGFTLTGATGISDTGFITGYGTNSSGQEDAFLLRPNAPVPEASSVVSLGLLLLLSLGGTAVSRRKAGKPR